MLITAFAVITFFIIMFIVKLIVEKRIKEKYERILLTGDKEKAIHIGKIYYLHVNKATKRSKVVINIEEKILEDLRAFNMVG